ncbi:MAG: hypothetical protein ACR2PL_14580 [Dehalococcoidia bacterium]
MAAEPIRIVVAPGSGLASALDKVAEATVLLEKDGATFRVTLEEPAHIGGE